MKRVTFSFLVVFVMLFGFQTTTMAQTLVAGDIAFIGLYTSGSGGVGDAFTFISLKAIPEGTVIYFTDDGWNNGAWGGVSSEVHFTWSPPAGGLPIGTIVTITGGANQLLPGTPSIGTCSAAFLSGTTWHYPTGEQILAYQSSSGARPASPTFIAGINASYNTTYYNSTTKWWTSVPSANAQSGSTLPDGLTNGVNCVSVFNATYNPAVANCRYNGSLTGTASEVRALINSDANWTRASTTPFDITSAAFSTPSITGFVAPTGTTNAATSISATGATLNGTINANNTSTTVTFQYGTTTGYGSTATATQSPVTGTTATSVSYVLSGLTPNTTYHFRVVGINAGGTTNGTDASFTTSALAPTVTTQAVTAITTTTATGNGNITSLGVPNPTQYGVVWSTSSGPTVALTTKTEQGTTSATGAFTSGITGLVPNTTYYVNAYATNAAGTSYGTEVSFATPLTKFILTTNATNGSITKSPDATSCDSNSVVQLTAAPNTGYRFTGWSGDLTGTTSPANITMNANKTVTAIFALNTYNLTVTSGIGGTISAPGSSPVTVNHGAATTITAAPLTGYTFVKWTRSSTNATITDSTQASTNVTLTETATITAVFAINTFSLTANATNGTIIKNPEQISYNYGTSVQLTATPSTGYSFTSWTGDLTGTTNPAAITMDANKTVTANFSINKYSLTVSAGTGGSITAPSASPTTVNHGAATTITAVPASGYSFVNWAVTSGTASIANSSSASTTVSLTSGAATVTANFAINAQTLTVNASNGSVVRSPDQTSYAYGTSVQLTATPSTGYSFTSWTGDLTGTTNPAAITMDANKTVTANFSINTYSLTVTSTTGGTISSPTTSPAIVEHGAITPITAAAQPGYTFIKWTRSSTNATIADSSLASTTVILTGAATVTAEFAINTATLIVNAINGTITKNPEQTSYNYGTSVQLTATPSTGYSFTGWTGDLTGATNPTSITMDVNKTVTANFAINTYTLTISAGTGGTITAPSDPTSTVNHGTATTITAAPFSGYTFVKWTRSSTNATIADSSVISTTVILSGAATITAEFALTTYSLTLTAATGGTITAPASSSASVGYGVSTTLTATPQTGYTFAKWDRSSTAATITDSTLASTSVAITAAATVTAIFSLNAPSTPVSILPKTDSLTTATSMSFVWNLAAPAIDKYCIQICSDSGMTVIVKNDTTITDTTCTLTDLTPGQTYYWQVRAHNASGWGNFGEKRMFTQTITTAVLPNAYSVALNGIRRNGGSMKFGLPQGSQVSMRLFSPQGKVVKVICSGYLAAGYHTANLNMSNFSRGFYILEFKAGSYVVKKTIPNL